MANLCPACNTQNIEGARFCRHCGRTLSLPSAGVFTDTPETGGPSAAPVYGSLYTPAAANPEFPLPTAGFWLRFAAFFIDSILLSIITAPGSIINSALQGRSGRPSTIGIVALLLGYLGAFAFLLFNAYLQGRDGASLGKKAVGLRCLDQSGQPLGFGRSILRELCKHTLSTCICYLGFFWMLWDKNDQTWHDKIMDSKVVQKI